MEKIQNMCFTIIVIIFSLLLTQTAWALDSKTDKPDRVVMVVVDNVTWSDITNSKLPVLKNLISKGSSGLMTTNPAGGGPRIPSNTYATIGAGAKILGGESGGMGFNTVEKFQNNTSDSSYYRRTGIKAKGHIVHLGIAQIESVNKELKYDYLPGSTGTILHRNGYKTAVIGNSDLPGNEDYDKYRRFAVSIAMDRNGQVDYGNVSSQCLTTDPEIPGGIRTDYRRLLNEFNRVKSKAQFIVIDSGDMSRLEMQSDLISHRTLINQKEKALKRLDSFLGQLTSEISMSKDILMIVVPNPSAEAMGNGDFLTPFIMSGRNVAGGLIWSGTTKRDGLISNTDIAATVVGLFALPPVISDSVQKKDIALNGQIILSRLSSDPVYEVGRLASKTAFIHNARYPFVRTYINTALSALIAAFLCLKLDVRAGSLLRPVLLGVTFMPAVFMLTDFLTGYSLLSAGLWSIAALIVLVLISNFTAKRFRFSPFMVSSGLTMAIVITDLFTGGSLSKSSPLSYDAAAGARFYGIGNEYMGILIGCTLIFSGLVFDRVKALAPLIRKFLALLLFVTVIYVISAPNLGTNAGGALAAIAGLGMAGVLLCGSGFNWKTVLPVAGCAVAGLAAFVLFDMTRAVETQSHMGRTIGLIRENGIDEIINIAFRKLEVNIKLIKYTSWSWFLVTGLLVVLLRHKLFPVEAELFEKENPWFNRLVPAIAAGSLVALVFNDSGVVAAATLLSYSAPAVMWEILKNREGRLVNGRDY